MRARTHAIHPTRTEGGVGKDGEGREETCTGGSDIEDGFGRRHRSNVVLSFRSNGRLLSGLRGRGIPGGGGGATRRGAAVLTGIAKITLIYF